MFIVIVVNIIVAILIFVVLGLAVVKKVYMTLVQAATIVFVFADVLLVVNFVVVILLFVYPIILIFN